MSVREFVQVPGVLSLSVVVKVADLMGLIRRIRRAGVNFVGCDPEKVEISICVANSGRSLHLQLLEPNLGTKATYSVDCCPAESVEAQ